MSSAKLPNLLSRSNTVMLSTINDHYKLNWTKCRALRNTTDDIMLEPVVSCYQKHNSHTYHITRSLTVIWNKLLFCHWVPGPRKPYTKFTSNTKFFYSMGSDPIVCLIKSFSKVKIDCVQVNSIFSCFAYLLIILLEVVLLNINILFFTWNSTLM